MEASGTLSNTRNTQRWLVRPDEELAAGIAKELQLEEEQLSVDKLT